ncbi:MAG: hypothetical protein U5L02_06210 [Rheinheimera sp.]|nr:hypothetical protein [Rheinheimera sp.]
MSAFHQYKKPNLNKSELAAEANKFKKSVTVGFAVIPFDDKTGGWLLPAGQNQVNRVLLFRDDAIQYATRMNDIMSRYPGLATRLNQYKQAEAA